MLIHINNRSLLKISGSDNKSFLQNQLTNDISKLTQTDIQINAYCQHQGKILALLWVMQFGDDFLISLPTELVNSIKSRLEIFILMSDVKISDITGDFAQIGVIDDPDNNFYRINDKLSLMINTFESLVNFGFGEIELWNKACIDSNLPEVYSVTAEKLVPQMLNLDIDELGVNFSKGCYPGQEVVARLHYLGEAKRRLFAFMSESEMQVGDSLYCASSKSAKVRGDRYKGSGIVVSKVKYNSLFYCLATLDVDLLSDKITINNEQGPQLNLIQK